MNESIIFNLGPSVGLTMLDILLLFLCPIFAALGTTVSAAIKRASNKSEFTLAEELPISELGVNEDALTEEDKLKLYNERMEYDYNRELRYIDWSGGLRLAYIGLVLGLVIALYFVGSIKQDITAIARILALSVLLGYQAPTLWMLQEKVIKDAAEKKLREISKGNKKP